MPSGGGRGVGGLGGGGVCIALPLICLLSPPICMLIRGLPPHHPSLLYTMGGH